VRALIDSELFKLRTTRTFAGILGGALGIVAAISLGAAFGGSYGPREGPGPDLLGIASLSQVFALVLGILALSTEFRHGTITPSLLAVPRRARLVVAKLAANTSAGLLLGLACFLLCVAIIALVLPTRDIRTGFAEGDVWEVVAGGSVAAGLYAALGVGLGALVRNQVGAVVAALGWVFVVEPLLIAIPGISDTVTKFGLNGLASALGKSPFGESSENLLAQLPAGLVLAGYATVAVAAGAAVLARRDVST
jgi:ABC-2 type transport system permease protein